MQHHDSEQSINIGSGEDSSLAELAALIADVIGQRGRVSFDSTKPDGTPRKLLDSRRIKALGWQPRIRLREGIQSTYEWLLANKSHFGRPMNWFQLIVIRMLGRQEMVHWDHGRFST